jgi:hypothetical protein
VDAAGAVAAGAAVLSAGLLSPELPQAAIRIAPERTSTNFFLILIFLRN